MCTATDLINEFSRDITSYAYKIVRVSPAVVGVEDLEQEARFALFKQADKISTLTNPDLRRNYCRLRIRGSMYDFLRAMYPIDTRKPEDAVHEYSLDSLLLLDGAILETARHAGDPTMESAQLEQGLQAIAANQRWAELLTYMLNGLNLKECGVAMGISESRACQLRGEILDTLKKYC